MIAANAEISKGNRVFFKQLELISKQGRNEINFRSCHFKAIVRTFLPESIACHSCIQIKLLFFSFLTGNMHGQEKEDIV